MASVKAGMGREEAHEIIKKHATTTTPIDLFKALASEKNFPLNVGQLNKLIQNPVEFAGNAIIQSRLVIQKIEMATKNKISKVIDMDLR
jgi:adenylosuccinate lyase